MYYEYKDPSLNGWLRLTDNIGLISDNYKIGDQQIHLLWNRGSNPVYFTLDHQKISLGSGQLTTCTYLQSIDFGKDAQELTIFSFSREFYCIKDHDQEVSCSGILFFGTYDLPIITLDTVNEERLLSLLNVFKDEFDTQDNIQGEMLQMLLKRLIILCTRMVREQLALKKISFDQADTIRQFNVLVDTHFREYHQVSHYADMLFKSPKTLSNLFRQFNSKSPLNIIHERIVLEGKRMLRYNDSAIKSIAYDLGYPDPSRFIQVFKKYTGKSPSEFRKSIFKMN